MEAAAFMLLDIETCLFEHGQCCVAVLKGDIILPRIYPEEPEPSRLSVRFAALLVDAFQNSGLYEIEQC